MTHAVAAESARPPLTVAAHAGTGALTALEKDWRSVFTDAVDADVFRSFGWCAAAARWLAADATPEVLVAGEPGGVARAVLPLVRRRRGRRLTRWWELASLTVPDNQRWDMLAAAGWEDEAASAFAGWLANHAGAWQRLSLDPLTATGADRLADALTAHGLDGNRQRAGVNRAIDLRGSWQDFYASRSRRLKKGNNLIANRLQRAGTVAVEWQRGSGITDASLEAVTAISAASWKRGTGTTLDAEGPRAFFTELARHGRREGWLSVWLLRLDGEAIACELQVIDGARVHALRGDFRDDAAELSPGTYLNWKVIEGLFGQGLTWYCFGGGDNAYKQRWTDAGDAETRIIAFSPGFRGRMLGAWETRLRPAAKRLLRRDQRSQVPEAASSS